MKREITVALLVVSLAACQGAVSDPPPGTNRAPLAVAGPEQAVFSNILVTLDGSASSDPDGDALTSQWEQTGGPTVTLTPSGTRATFTSPAVTAATTLVFRLSVSDGKLTTTASTAVTINPAVAGNRPPTASATASPTVAAGALVQLDGSASSDPDGDSLSFVWTQTSGPQVTLTAADQAKASFQAPAVTASTALVFSLAIADGRGGSAQATVTVNVLPASSNRAPTATVGGAQSVSAGATVTLTGSATDPDGDALTYRWTQSAGTAVALATPTQATTTFVAPSPAATATLTFNLVATDAKGLASAPATVQVTVNPGTLPTVAFTKVVSLHAVTRTGIVVFFLTDVAVKASVDYGKVSTGEATFTEAAATTRHVMQLSGLTADTKYVYTVRAGTATAQGSFTTAIDYAANPKPFSFAVVGDARGHATWATVAAAVKAKSPRFMVQTGDNNDAAGSAANWADYYLVAKGLFAEVPVFAAQGNHDTGSNFSVYNLAPPSSSNSDLYYAFVYGNAGFVAINTNQSSATMNSWVQNALTTLSGGPLFAFHHHPLYSCGSHGSSTSLQGTYQTMFEGAKLTTDFTGHDHDLIYWSTVNSVRYVVSGGGGTSLYSLSGCQGPYSTSGYGFMMVNVNGASVTQTFYDQNGTQLYTSGAFNAQGASVPLSSLGGLVVY